MRRFLFGVMLSACVGVFGACGGSDDDTDPVVIDDGNGEGDTGEAPAPPPPPEENPAAVGIGQVCSQESPCPQEAPICLVFAQGATSGMCTASCGTTPIPEGGQAEPPNPQMDTVCPTYSGSGTSMCVLGLQGEPAATEQEWACAVLCGPFESPQGSGDLGECPGGLTCGASQANLCSP